MRSPSPDPHIERHNTPPPQSNEAIPNWVVELKAQNEYLQKHVEGLTTLVISLNSTVVSQAEEIKKLKKPNFKLSHSYSSKVKSFKRLVQGPRPSFCHTPP
ncbi:hypothetical protein L1987_21421 [Smallanthus sonchifolius]|uniref:Uncharacterized protein n=1 Tax=Smallanthus sonchifolius TaxID=185202 RepID=A0ACB9IVI9_9ASTR|nr:hypothetical protein L1987_21421 [Smallanthus sonchifolius]